MDIVAQLKLAASAVTLDGKAVFNTVFYGDDFEANARTMEDLAYPMAQIIPIISSSVNISKTGMFFYQWEIFVFFCDIQQQHLDATPDQKDTIIQRMSDAAIQFTVFMEKTRLFGPIAKVSFKNLFFKQNNTITGVLANFTLTEKQGKRLC